MYGPAIWPCGPAFFGALEDFGLTSGNAEMCPSQRTPTFAYEWRPPEVAGCMFRPQPSITAFLDHAYQWDSLFAGASRKGAGRELWRTTSGLHLLLALS